MTNQIEGTLEQSEQKILQKQRISVFGLGYVGSVTSACFAQIGHNVIGVDVNPAKVDLLNQGRSPIVEAQVNEIAAESHAAGRLRATTNSKQAILESSISFICVATPSQRNGKLDLRSVQKVCTEIGEALREKDSFHIVVLRSTALPGTTASVVAPELEKASGKRAGRDFAVCMNPEFMREGTAVADFFHPPFTVLGSEDPKAVECLRDLYSFTSTPFFATSIGVAEMVKYVCNTFHALKVSFANEVGTICQHLGIDANAVTKIYTADTKLNISPAYLTPGFAFGGSCLPKDLRALTYRSKELDLELPLLESIMPSNQQHLERASEAILRTGKRRIGVIGLSFKAGTDDLRESPSVQLIKRLIGEGCQIKIWDEQVALGRLVGSNRQFIEEVIPHIGSLMREDLKEVVSSCDVVVLATKAVSHDKLAPMLRDSQEVFDLLNPTSPRLDMSLAKPAVVG